MRRRTTAACAASVVALAMLLAASPANAQFARASLTHDGGEPNDNSYSNSISANGRFVVFSSRATNVVPNDTNGATDIFVRDLVANTTERVSVTSAGTEGTGPIGAALGAISDDGTIVIFSSYLALAPEDTVPCAPNGGTCLDIYAHDRTTHTTTLLTRGLGGAPANGASPAFQISADARFVAFASDASNLVANDTNGASDIFVLDRTTGTIERVSVGPNGEQGANASTLPAISGNGAVVAFTTTNNVTNDDCPPESFCQRLVVKTRATGAVRQFALFLVNPNDFLLLMSLDEAGNTIAVRGFRLVTGVGFTLRYHFLDLYDLAGGGRERISQEPTNCCVGIPTGVAVSRDGRFVAYEQVSGIAVYDRTRNSKDSIATSMANPSFSADGRYIAFSSSDAFLVPGDTNAKSDAFRYDRDTDADGMSNVWETAYGFDPANAADAALDPDGDGRTNLQEFLAASHPKGTHARHFAEGVTNQFFSTNLTLFNPTDTDSLVVVRLFGENGETRSIPLTLRKNRRERVSPSGPTLPGQAFSVVVESDQPLVADRLTTWGYPASTGGSGLETGIEAPATTWHFAEGATGSGFSLYYLLSNPGDTDASVTVDYLRPSPAPVLSESVPVPAHSRVSLDVASRFPELLAGTISAKLTSTQPIVAERAMYRSTPQATFIAGHAGAGIVTPAPRWFLAEGATGFFDEYVLVSNPGATDTEVKFTFLTPSAAAFDVTRPVAANSRFTLDLKEFDALANTAVSVIAASIDNTPIVVERVMWWPSGGEWYEASLSAGVTGTGTKWAIAEAGQAATLHTYILVANTDPVRDGQAKITLFFDLGDPVETFLSVPHNGRATLDVGTIPQALDKNFSIIVEAVDGLPIVVERSLYQDLGGLLFAAGGTSVATNITPVP